jgi:PAS domain-containing protein
MLQDDPEVITKGETEFIPGEPYTDAQGDLRFLQTIKVPFHLPGDKTPAVLRVAIVITERKRSEEALQAAHEQYEGIIELLPDATFVVDRAGNVIAWNRAIEEMTGARKENQHITDLKPGPHLKMSVSDTGAGMDAQTVEHILEPCFTTNQGGWKGNRARTGRCT